MFLKKMIAMFCCILLLCSIITGTVFASGPGDGNIDGGGGNMGSGTSSNKWTPGNDGVRITVVNAATRAPVSETVDFSNKSRREVFCILGRLANLIIGMEAVYPCRLVGDTAALSQRLLERV